MRRAFKHRAKSMTLSQSKPMDPCQHEVRNQIVELAAQEVLLEALNELTLLLNLKRKKLEKKKQVYLLLPSSPKSSSKEHGFGRVVEKIFSAISFISSGYRTSLPEGLCAQCACLVVSYPLGCSLLGGAYPMLSVRTESPWVDFIFVYFIILFWLNSFIIYRCH